LWGADEQHIFDTRQHERVEGVDTMGLSYTGMSCLLAAWGTGYRRVPEPPARMMPFFVVMSIFLLKVFLNSRADLSYRSSTIVNLPPLNEGY